MVKFCGNCGAPLDNDAKVCGQCGTPSDGNYGKISGFKVVNPEKKKKLIKKLKIVIVLVILILFAVTVIKIICNFTGANGLVRKVMASYEKYDIDTIISLSSDMYYYSDYENYVEEYFEYEVGQIIDDFEAVVGHSYKMTYKVEEIYELSKRKQDEMLKDIENVYPDFDVNLINKIKVANVNVTAKQGRNFITKNINITMSKEGKTWKVLYLE